MNGCVRFCRRWSARLFRRPVGVLLATLLVLTAGGVPASADDVQALLNEIDQVARSVNGAGSSATPSELAVADQLTHDYRMAQARYKLYESVLLAIFALVSLVIVMGFLAKKPNSAAIHLVNASGLVFVIFGTLFLVLLADVDEQLNAGIGIMGAVAGYLFGTMRARVADSKEKAPED